VFADQGLTVDKYKLQNSYNNEYSVYFVKKAECNCKLALYSLS